MRTFLLTAVILSVLLTSCGTLEMNIEDPAQATPAASDSHAAGSAPLGLDSPSEEIQRTLLESPLRWRTLFMDAQVTASGQEPRHVQVWVDQPNLSLRVLSGPPGRSADSFRVADGRSLLDLNIPTGESSLAPFPVQNLTVPFTPVPGNNPPGVAEAHPLSTLIPVHDLSGLVFPSDRAQNEGLFRPITTEVVAYRLCLVVDWTYIQNSLPSYRAWVDVSTGVLMRLQQFEKEGGTTVINDVTVTRVDYDLPLPQNLFSPVLRANPDFSLDPLAAADAPVTPAAFTETDPLGSVYAFIADNNYPVRTMRLVRLPASCMAGKSACPAPDVIETPVALTSSLQPMVWSPVRAEAAWAYPLNEEQRIWMLYLFNAEKQAWSELASFDRYMDPPMWSQDGEWLAFRLQDGQGGSAVYAMRRDGSQTKVLTDLPGLPAADAPYVMDSTLGNSFVLRPARLGQTGTLYRVLPEDGTVTPFLETRLIKAPFLESPDGTMIATITSEEAGPAQVLRLFAADGQTVLRDLATFTSGSLLGLAWSPGGRQLAFVHRTDAVATVYVIGADGGNLRQAYTSATDIQFIFSPDGKYILVQTIDGTGEHIYTIHLESLEAHLAQAPGIALNEAWMFPAWR